MGTFNEMACTGLDDLEKERFTFPVYGEADSPETRARGARFVLRRLVVDKHLTRHMYWR